MEYIEREAAIKAIESVPDGNWRSIRYAKEVKAIPAADVVPVRHGRWVVSRTDYSWNSAEFPTHCKCNQCGREIPYLDRDAYCPTCGARMDGDGDV